MLVLAAAVSAQAPVRPQISIENGEKVFRLCAACHEVGEGARNGVGPMLNDLIGRRTGSLPEYSYSSALIEAGRRGMSWDEEALARFLADPRGFMPATRMVFPGLRNAGDRRDVIAYVIAHGRGGPAPATRKAP